MPQYEYECEKCGKTATKLRRMEDRNEPIECGDCGGKSLRIVSRTGEPSFKGGGWTPKHHG